jgi:hypothetical protein
MAMTRYLDDDNAAQDCSSNGAPCFSSCHTTFGFEGDAPAHTFQPLIRAS